MAQLITLTCSFGDGKLGGEFGRRRDGNGRAAWLPRDWGEEEVGEARGGVLWRRSSAAAAAHGGSTARSERDRGSGEVREGGSGMKTSERGAVARMRGSARPRVARHQQLVGHHARSTLQALQSLNE
jgi:hypothetical protein